MAVVNPLLSPIVYHTTPTSTSLNVGGGPGALTAGAGLGVSVGGIGTASIKDSRWLTLDVCREYTRNKCTRTEDECRFAHPPSNVEVQNGRVMCCFDSIKGKCQRRDPPCKYLHPPQHLKEQLLQNGRNNLILRHLQMQMMANSIPGIYPILYDLNTGKSFPAAAAAAASAAAAANYFPLQGHEPYVVPRYLLPVSGTTACYSPFYAAAPYAISNPATASSAVYTHGPSGSAAGSPSSDINNLSSQQQLVLIGDQLTGDRNDIGSCAVTSCSTANGVMPLQCASPLWQPPPPQSVTGPVTSGANNSAMSVDGANFTSPAAALYFQTPVGPANVPAGSVIPTVAMKQQQQPPSSEQMGKCAGVPNGGISYYQPAAIAYQQMTLAAMQLQQPATYVPIPIAGQAAFDPRY